MTHYYDKTQDSPFHPGKIKATLRNRSFEFYIASGVFSPKRIDAGTYLLIEKSKINPNDSILDLGCGYGPVGITLAKLFPKSKVTMTDINMRAIKLARMNLKLYNLENVKVLQGDGFEKIKEKFDVILLNPPQSAGKKLCEQLIEQSKNFINPKGTIQIVARHNKGGKSFEIFMEHTYGNVETLAKKGGYRIYQSHIS